MFHQTFGAMNTRFSMVLPAVDAQDGAMLAREVQALLRQQETMMSRFDTHGELFALNRTAAHAAMPVSDGLWQVLEACGRHHRMTGGAFDIAQGGRPGHRGMHLLELDPVARTMRFSAPGVLLDLGGIGKGIALDLAGQRLRGLGVDQAFLSFGESSVSVIGRHPAADHWPIAVEHMFQSGTALYRFDLRDEALSTSGNRTGEAHIINPLNGRPVAGHRTVSVACAGAADAEALSTALFAQEPAERDRVLKNYPAARAVEFDYVERDGTWIVKRKWHHDEQTT